MKGNTPPSSKNNIITKRVGGKEWTQDEAIALKKRNKIAELEASGFSPAELDAFINQKPSRGGHSSAGSVSKRETTPAQSPKGTEKSALTHKSNTRARADKCLNIFGSALGMTQDESRFFVRMVGGFGAAIAILIGGGVAVSETDTGKTILTSAGLVKKATKPKTSAKGQIKEVKEEKIQDTPPKPLDTPDSTPSDTEEPVQVASVPQKEKAPQKAIERTATGFNIYSTEATKNPEAFTSRIISEILEDNKRQALMGNKR